MWDQKYLAPLTCLSEVCNSTGSQRFQERRENILRNMALREAVYAVFVVGETALEFPASRPRVVGSRLHLPKFELRQLRSAIKLATEASFGAIQMAWMMSLEKVCYIQTFLDAPSLCNCLFTLILSIALSFTALNRHPSSVCHHVPARLSAGS